jgi:integrase
VGGAQLDATLISVLAYSGLRPQEARALLWRDVGARSLRVERAATGRTVKPTKTGKIRTVRLLAPLAADLSAWSTALGQPGGDALVFPTQSGRLMADTDYRNWRRRVYEPAARKVGIDGRPYDLRHSFASLLIYEGRPAVDVAGQIGASTETTLKTYVHVFEEFDPALRVTAVGVIEAVRAESDVRGGQRGRG